MVTQFCDICDAGDYLNADYCAGCPYMDDANGTKRYDNSWPRVRHLDERIAQMGVFYINSISYGGCYTTSVTARKAPSRDNWTTRIFFFISAIKSERSYAGWVCKMRSANAAYAASALSA